MDVNIDHVPDGEADTNLFNYDTSLVPEGALVIHHRYGKNIIVTRDGQVIKKGDFEIPVSFYLVNRLLTRGTPRYISNATNPNDYRTCFEVVGYSQEEIDRVIEIIPGENVKGD